MTSLTVDIKQFQGITLRQRGPTISHLFFADDSIFFFQVTTSACRNLQGLLQRLCAISGQVTNLQKLLVKFSPNTPQDTQQTFKGIFRMNASNSLGKYLGTNVDIQGTKVRHFTPLLDTVATIVLCHNL